jgi:hypothetical protein
MDLGVLMAVNMKPTLLLYVTLCGLVDRYKHSGGTCWLIFILDPESGASMFFQNTGAYLVNYTRRPMFTQQFRHIHPATISRFSICDC